MSRASQATAYTLEFVRSVLPPGCKSILEIGCGKGEVAAALVKDGFAVIAIDSDPDAVAAARSVGVDARIQSWPTAMAEQFDAVLFTRSLHHIGPLEAVVEAAVEVLRPSGRVIVEDFRFELESPRNHAWFSGLMRLLAATGAFDEATLAVLLSKLDQSGHHHELHSSTMICEALSRRGAVEEQDAAYYFRYAEPDLPEAVARRLLDYELAMIEAGTIDALGRRFVLSPMA